MKIGDFDPETIGLAEQLREVERGIEQMWRSFPRLVANSRMSAAQKDKRIATMIAVRDGLRVRLEQEKADQKTLL